MSSSALQLTFTIRVSSGVNTIHLVGSWDGYKNQLPLSKDKHAAKAGSWKGTFRFQPTLLESGQRYWYYYVIDGYQCAVNPTISSTVEPTTGRELNILDVPSKSSSSSKDKESSSKHHSSSSSSRDKDRRAAASHSSSAGGLSLEIPKGRPLSQSKIMSPKPRSPMASKNLLGMEDASLDSLSAHFGYASLQDSDGEDMYYRRSSPNGSDYLSSEASEYSSGYSSSGYSTPGSVGCTCERYGITRRGDRVKIDCGGRRCGDAYTSSECSSDEEQVARSPVSVKSRSSASSRRHGVVIR